VSLAHPRGAFCCEKLIPEFLSALTILLPPPDEEEEANERIIADNPPPNDDVNFAATMKCERFPKYFFIICILIAQLAGLMYGKLDSERGFRGWKKDPEVTSNKASQDFRVGISIKNLKLNPKKPFSDASGVPSRSIETQSTQSPS
jgi:hypothetical protein